VLFANFFVEGANISRLKRRSRQFEMTRERQELLPANTAKSEP
jgi:hypothetical protein